MLFKTLFTYIFIAASLIVGSYAFITPKSFAVKRSQQRPVFSIDVKDKALSEVLEDISDASGYSIILNGENDDLPVSLKLRNVGLEETLKRVLRDVNYTVVWDDSSRKVFLSVYGKQETTVRTRAMVPGYSGNTGNAKQPIKPPGMFPRTVPGPNGQPIRHTIQRGARPTATISGRNTRFAQTTSTLRNLSMQ